MQTGTRPDAIDTRWVFRGYAGLAWLVGFLVLSWGPMWFGSHLADQQWGKAALIRVAGAFLIADGFCAAAMAAVEDAPSRRRGLLLFSIGHALFWLVLWIQQMAIWESALGDRVVQATSAVTFLLFYLWATSEGEHQCSTLRSLFSSTAPDSTERLRSHYEQQIRAAARQEERNRLARELHDSIKQQIFVVQTAAATVQARLQGDPGGAREAVDRIREAARDAMGEMEAMLDQLRAAPLGNTGLVESLKKQCEALQARTGARVEFRLGTLPAAQALAPGAHEAVLRVAQEALANVGRHARAGCVRVSLDSNKGYVVLTVSDDGAGFDANQQDRGQGLGNMRARAEEFGGTFELTTAPGTGTSVAFSVPYTPADRPAEYRRRAVIAAALLACSVLVLLWTRTPGLAAVALVSLIGVVRYTLAFRRAQETAW